MAARVTYPVGPAREARETARRADVGEAEGMARHEDYAE